MGLDEDRGRRFRSVYITLSAAWFGAVLLVPGLQNALVASANVDASPVVRIMAVLLAHVATSTIFFRPLSLLTSGRRLARVVLAAAFPPVFAGVFWVILGFVLWVMTGASFSFVGFATLACFVPFLFVMHTYGAVRPAGIASVAWLRFVSRDASDT